MALGQVQRWVMSIVVLGVVGLHSAAMAAAPMAFDTSAPGATPGLLLISGFFGVMAIVAAHVIHKRSPLHWSLILGWIPAAIFFPFYY